MLRVSKTEDLSSATLLEGVGRDFLTVNSKNYNFSMIWVGSITSPKVTLGVLPSYFTGTISMSLPPMSTLYSRPALNRDGATAEGLPFWHYCETGVIVRLWILTLLLNTNICSHLHRCPESFGDWGMGVTPTEIDFIIVERSRVH